MRMLAIPGILVLAMMPMCSNLRRPTREQQAFVSGMGETWNAVEEEGKQISEAQLREKLGPPDIRVTIAELAKRAQSDPKMDSFLQMVYPIRLRGEHWRPWREDKIYLESTLIIYDETLRYEKFGTGGPQAGPRGCAYLLRQGVVLAARPITQAQLWGSLEGTEGWTELLKPEDFVTPPKYPRYRTKPESGGNR